MPAGPIATDDTEQSGSGYDAVRGDGSIQFAPIDRPAPSEPPSWLNDLADFLSSLFEPVGQAFGSSWPVFKWILIAGAAALLLYLLWKLLAPVLSLKLTEPDDDEQAWVPEASEALALLDDADRLAREGHYGAATHLLLKRSVGQIAAARPEWVEPSSTARELAALPALPAAARAAFDTIAGRVEVSIFALKSLSRDDWETARAAYADFALQSLQGVGR